MFEHIGTKYLLEEAEMIIANMDDGDAQKALSRLVAAIKRIYEATDK